MRPPTLEGAVAGAGGELALRAPANATPLGAIFGAILAAATVAVGLLGLAHLPFTLCYFKAATGLPCLTCGTTRMLDRLFHLDLAGALAMNPLAAAGALGIAAWALVDLALLPRGRAVALSLGPRSARAARVLTVVLLLANWAYLIIAGR